MEYFKKLINKFRFLLVNIIITGIKFDRMNFVSFLQKKSHEKTYEILGEQFSNSLLFEDKHELWDFVINQITNEKLQSEADKSNICLEFGVGGGESLRYFSKKLLKKNIKIVGFDTFFGNPQIWPGTNNQVGSSNQNGMPPKNLPANVEIVQGYIEETLQNYLETNQIKKIKFMHIDVNIYSAAKFILEITKKYTDNNTLILFDELINYPFWWNNGEYKALAEVYSSSQYKYLALDHTKRALIQLV
jgi:hypothetical protein